MFRVAGGRPLAPLLFVTSRDGLRRNIGPRATERLLAALATQALLVHDVPPGARCGEIARLVRQHLRRQPEVRGVVLIGGYDVIPSHRMDTLPKSLRSRLDGSPDPDRFIVWSDEPYGDADGDGLPELPVSRVPDGRSASLLRRALEAASTVAPRRRPRAGLRNLQRPFAQAIFDALPGTKRMLRSARTVSNQRPRYDLEADRIYVVLHGESDDAGRAWGQDRGDGFPLAMTPRNVPEHPGVVFSACCWGALTVDIPAADWKPGRQLHPRKPSQSIALRALERGARAFIGCTAAHYSPTQAPYAYFGGPLHRAFWRRIGQGKAPARALFEAKYYDFLPGIPHGQTTPLSKACELKVLHEFTCLGLGW